MKLFAVRDEKNEVISGTFQEKKGAKEYRDSLETAAFVTKASDHWLFRDKPVRRQEKKRKNRKN